MEYKVLQITDIDNCDYLFESYEYAKKHGFDKKHYSVVYESKFKDSKQDTDTILNALFALLNYERPSDFKGHSMSVSDLVELGGETYYCDKIGWKRI
jgi:hypothetical protein